ncbi:DUF4912 domain-containing protein [Paenibacillus alba]|uniref:DUF4912 domain-containing protein n=1 Tax=Paenibacillus alba TaxID=1197127 RepID=A0ABU6G7X9_9BACL|nr:DUF4912 domain-containing protein [Paenibacillus alba]MEC0230288.1 DUF4912 domain-containing protein [Paenibacillus alba]
MSPIPTQALSAESFDRDTLQLLVQSPSVLFVYWQLSTRTARLIHEHFSAQWKALQPTLRIYAAPDQEGDDSQKDTQISQLPLPEGNSCFLSGVHPGQSCYADLGIVNELGQFLSLLRSNTVQTPYSLMNKEDSTSMLNQEQLETYRLAPVSLKLVPTTTCEYFSAYSVYAPKSAYAADTESGGDTD